MIRRLAALFIVALMVGGCAAEGEKPLTQQEKAKLEWNAARAGVLFSLARSQYDNGNFDACRKTLDNALKMEPNSARIHLLSARLSIEQGRLELAQKELQFVRELEPTSAEADYLSGIIYQRWQRPQTALEFYVAAYDKAPAELAYLLARAETLVALDRRDEALSLLKEKLTYFENSAYIRDITGQLLVQAGQYAEAAKMLRQASILAPDDGSIREHLGLAHYWAGDYREAAYVLGRLVAEERFAGRVDLQIALGESQFQSGRYREARECFQWAAERQPAAPSVWLSLAKAALKLDDIPRAEMSLHKALALDPASAEPQVMLGYVRLRQDRLDDALLAFSRASALDPTDAVALCMSGYVLEKQGKPGEAVGYYGRALKIRPDDELAATLMAQIRLDE